MSEALQHQDDDERKEAPTLPQITKFPAPEDQQLVDAILRDPLTSAAEHLQAIKQRSGTKGYKDLSSAGCQAWKRLQKPEVKAYMRIQQERIRVAANLEGNDLLQQIAGIMLTDMTQVAEWDDQGRVTVKASDELSRHARGAIKKLKTKTTTRHFENGDTEETTNTEIELYSRLEAIKLFAEVAGIKDSEGTISVQNGVIVLNPPQTEAEATKGKTIHEG